MSDRQLRVGKTIKEELGRMVERGEIKDPRIGFVTITDIDISPDIRHAKIYYSALGNRKAREQAGAGLNSARSFIRGELGKRLRLKYVPELEFRFDESVEAAARIAKLLHKIHEERGPERQDSGNNNEQ